MESPPKRMTRARAAAKASEGTVKTTRIVTAAARAKSTATASTKSTAAKRKTRADENEEDEEEHEVPVPRRARGRPKKAEEPEAPARPLRARAVRKPAAEAPKEESAAAAKPTRGRPRKVVAAEPAAQPAKKSTRARAGTASTRTAAAKAAPKKTVKFQEPDKENIEPAVEPKEPARTGIRGRPAKRGGAVGARTTRAAVRTATTDQKPLSPKKMTQMPVTMDDSEDELADPTPVKPMMRHPIKPPTAKKTDPTPLEEKAEETATVDSVLNPPGIAAALASPARRMPTSPPKDTMKSPARRIGPVQLPGSTMKSTGEMEGGNGTSFKASLMQSAAKRPPSPIKGLTFAKPSSQHPQSAMKASLLLSPAKRALPGMMPLTEPRQRDPTAYEDMPIMKPLVLPSTTRPSDKLLVEESDDMLEDPFTEPMESLQFPGRLSAVLPRHADPAWKKDMGIVDAPSEHVRDEAPVESNDVPEDVIEVAEQPQDDPVETAAENVMAVEDTEDEASEPESRTPPHSPTQDDNPIYQLRQKDLDPYHSMDSESEDESEPLPKAVPKTPKSQPTPSVAALGGFTALAERFGSWSAASPIKMAPLSSSKKVQQSAQEQISRPSSQASVHYFDDEMTVRLNAEAASENQPGIVDEPYFDDIMVTEEDVALAHEANEMSLLEPDKVESAGDLFDDTLSDASQEYGDENELPVDPALANSHSNAPVTPVRPVMKRFNTTTKVPLKPADDSTPSPLKKRSFTASRVAPKRPTGPSKSANSSRKSMPVTHIELASGPSTPNPVTPSKADLWSSLGTPARTPRRDIDPALLRGAVVFVDVHTSEGADASSIFVELLTQMGAKCLKSWAWNPSGAGDSVSKVGITHVVYKDGGKRTLEKVRQSNGIVQCVGVSWVLE